MFLGKSLYFRSYETLFVLWKGFLTVAELCLLTVVCIRESTKPILCSKWGHFDGVKPILKILLASWTFYTVEKRFRSFNLGSVSQGTAKLLTIKLCPCTLFGLYGSECASAFGPDSRQPGIESFVPQISASKDLNLFSIV